MSSHLVEGRSLPDQIARHAGLELCNTVAGWGSPTPKEYLTDYDALALWAGDTGLIDAADCRAARRSPSRAGAAVLGRARALRSALYTALTADGDLAPVHAAAAAAMHRAHYTRADGAIRLQVAPGATAPLDAAALAAHELLTAYGPAAVGRCGGVGCGWLFLDPTARRRWCDMAVCGNRAKARRHAARARAGD